MLALYHPVVHKVGPGQLTQNPRVSLIPWPFRVAFAKPSSLLYRNLRRDKCVQAAVHHQAPKTDLALGLAAIQRYSPCTYAFFHKRW